MPRELPLQCDWPAFMRRAQDGDQSAYRLVLAAMVPVIGRLVRRRVFNEALIEDVTQDTLLTVHRLLHTYDPDRPLLPWVAAIVSARSVDALRRSGRAGNFEVTDEDAMVNACDPASTAIEDTLGDDHELARLLAPLPRRQRMMVEMVKLREMSLDDAAKASSVSVSAVKSLLHRALASLRENGRS